MLPEAPTILKGITHHTHSTECLQNNVNSKHISEAVRKVESLDSRDRETEGERWVLVCAPAHSKTQKIGSSCLIQNPNFSNLGFHQCTSCLSHVGGLQKHQQLQQQCRTIQPEVQDVV